MRIDYDTAAATYDNTRAADDEVISRFAARVSLQRDTSVLDFGCGTGNHLLRIQQVFGCRCSGVEPSAEMRAKAQQKLPGAQIVAGDHGDIPLLSDSFDFAYMTDVVHHVPDRLAMFDRLARVLKTAGTLCIVTQSHAQIAARFFNRFFPSLEAIEQSRHPAIESLVAEARSQGFNFECADTLSIVERNVVTPEFVRNAEQKNWSMFRLLPAHEFQHGLAALRQNLGSTFDAPGAGRTLLWFIANK